MYQHRKHGMIKRFILAVREIREAAATAFVGPCGHECSGDAKSWSCPTCGSSGSSS